MEKVLSKNRSEFQELWFSGFSFEVDIQDAKSKELLL